MVRRSMVAVGVACVIVVAVLFVSRAPAPAVSPPRCPLSTCQSAYAVGYREGYSSPKTNPEGVVGPWTRQSVCQTTYDVVEDPSDDKASYLAGCVRGWDASLAAATGRHRVVAAR